VYLGSYLGILGRIGLQFYPSSQLVDGVLYDAFFANVAGSFVIGFVVAGHTSYIFTKFPYFYDFFTVGYTGSLTTFSAWQAQSAIKIISYGYIVYGLLCIFVGFCCSLCAFKIGLQFGEFIFQELPCSTAQTKVVVVPVRVALLLFLFILITIGILIGTLYVPNAYINIILPLLCGPIGSCIRYVISIHNKQFEAFPLFTFLANVIGAFLYSVVYVCGSTVSSIERLLRFWNYLVFKLVYFYYQSSIKYTSTLFIYLFRTYIDSSILTGFLGCLTTVSTLVYQVHTLSPKHAWIYSLTTVISAQCLCLIVTGIAVLKFEILVTK